MEVYNIPEKLWHSGLNCKLCNIMNTRLFKISLSPQLCKLPQLLPHISITYCAPACTHRRACTHARVRSIHTQRNRVATHEMWVKHSIIKHHTHRPSQLSQVCQSRLASGSSERSITQWCWHSQLGDQPMLTGPRSVKWRKWSCSDPKGTATGHCAKTNPTTPLL